MDKSALYSNGYFHWFYSLSNYERNTLKIKIVGYEGCRRDSVCAYGAAAVLTENDRLYNSCLKSGGDHNGSKELDRLDGDVLTKMEVPLEIDDNDEPMFVFDFPASVFDQAPYEMVDKRLMKLAYGWLGSTKGETRAYHVFDSMRHLHMWLCGMHFKQLLMVRPKE